MDRVHRAYAQTAWTALDPLQGLEPEVRRAILLLPSTFRERFKLAPWTTRDQRRRAIGEILAERRLMLELMRPPQPAAPAVAQVPVPASAAPIADASTALSPYYRLRLTQLAGDRQAQDAADLKTNPLARADHQRRSALRQRFHDIQVARARLDLEEAQLFDPPEDLPLAAASVPPVRTKARKKKRERGRDR